MSGKTLRLGLLIGGALLATACGETTPRQYGRNDLQLATAYTAKELCSCVFVMGQTEDYCRAWTKASPDVTAFHVDHDAKTVKTAAILLWGGRARYAGEQFGCVLE